MSEQWFVVQMKDENGEWQELPGVHNRSGAAYLVGLLAMSDDHPSVCVRDTIEGIDYEIEEDGAWRRR